MKPRRQLKHTDLFLVRFWTQEVSGMSEEQEWGGKVQRVVDGEAHQFQDWEALVDTLRAMLAATSTGPTGAPDTTEPRPSDGLARKGE
ncbi:MAG: hypothetical protein M3014_11915 [Chloroflexota bacterium]|nr:hypothetical protein [Chloroflexota bacterium]